MSLKQVANLGGFLAVLAVCLVMLSAILLPAWDSWNDDNMVAGFYEQPNDSIEVAFIGPSTIASDISTIDMLQDRNLCSYSFGAGHEPLISSYYWLKEVHRLHGNSLKTVVLDPAPLFYTKGETNRSAFAAKATGHMQFSPLKLESLWEYSRHYSDFDFVENLIPAIKYHSRWNALLKKDYDFVFGEGIHTASHGQNITFMTSAGNTEDKKLFMPNYSVNDDCDKSLDDLLKNCQKYNVEVLNRFVEFCNQNDLKLVFAALPHKDWTDDKHDTVKAFAEKNNIPFTDINSPEIQEEIGLYMPLDLADSNHANVNGARKITRYIGDFLEKNGVVASSKTRSYPDKIKADIAEYNAAAKGMELTLCTSFERYLDLCANAGNRYAILITSKKDVACGLNDTTRAALKKLGLTKLASADTVSSYAALIDGGTLLAEKLSKDPEKGAFIKCAYENGNITYVKNKTIKSEIPRLLAAYSKPAASKGQSIVKMNGEELGENKDGLSFVVIDKQENLVIDTCTFNACTNSERITDLIPDSYDKTVSKLKKQSESEK